MNAIHAYETALWNSIPYEIRNVINDNALRGRFYASYHILVGITKLWDAIKNGYIRDTLTKLGYETELKPQVGDGKGNIIEYELMIYWEQPRKMTYWD